ncbi:MAG: hypothetical protein LBJ35_05885 [Spirochaetaceae bacterium]|jgi:hypothetical protein|nr:hypothetical protein [Spirochaetaceae bacterium]
MKRFLLIASLLAFSSALTFADISLGGSLVGNWIVVESTSSSDFDDFNTYFRPYNGGLSSSVRGRLNVSAVNNENTFGGWMQFRAQAGGPADFRMLTSVWWQPLSSIKVTYGYMWAGANPIGVVLTDDDVLAMRFYGRSANYIPWAYEIMSGAHIELTPIENLYILGSVPLDNSPNLSYNGWNSPYTVANGDATAEDIFKHTMARAAYTIPGVGTARLTFAGGTGNVSDGSLFEYTSAVHAPGLGSVDASVFDIGFTYTALENLKLDIGFEFPLQGNDWLKAPPPPYSPSDIKAHVPVAVNLRANASSGAFDFAGGVSAKFGGKYTVSDIEGNDNEFKFEQGFILGFTLNPAYDLGPLTIGVVGELELNTKDKVSFGDIDYTYDSRVNWSVIPYVQKNVFSGGTVYAGFQIASNLTKSDSSPADKFEWDQGFDWSIPVGLIYYF